MNNIRILVLKMFIYFLRNIGIYKYNHGFRVNASKEVYTQIHQAEKNKFYKNVTQFESNCGYSIDNFFFETLALHTQVVIKKSKINYQHGRILYSLLRKYIHQKINTNNFSYFNIFESGTARGFSTICLAKAIVDSKVNGHVISIDILPHNSRMIWNIIDDNERPKSRNEILSKWEKELQLITFFEGNSKKVMNKIGLSRINFAFLDAHHTYDSVKNEYNYIKKFQKKGDIIVFDDVTKLKYEGVVQLVNEVENSKEYNLKHIDINEDRSIAIAIKND